MKRRTPSRPGGPATLATFALLVAVATLVTAGCTEDVGTSVRISLVYKDGWNLAAADVIASKVEKQAPISHEMLVLIADDMAGEVMSLEVWGVRDGERIAHGSAVALPRKGDTVGATIVLERLPCGVFCTPGDLRCEPSGLSTCGADADGCLQWGEPEACPVEMPFCSAGACRVDCVNECVAGSSTCVDAMTESRCGEYDNDLCLDNGASRACPGGQRCYAGRCAVPCTFGSTLVNAAIADSASPFNPSIAIDAAGTVHAVYSVAVQRTLRYASRPRGGSWSSWVDIGAAGQVPSLAVDALGKLHLTFYDPAAPNVGFRYGSRAASGGAWSFETIKAGTNVGASSAMVLDAAGTPHTVACDLADGPVYYSYKAGASWVSEVVTAGPTGTAGGSRCDLALAGTIPHLSFYSDDNNLVHAERTGASQWVREIAARPTTATVSAGAKTSIAIDRAGTVHIAYLNTYGLLADYYELALASKVGGWAAEGIDYVADTGNSADLVVDPFDGLHIVYRPLVSPKLQYAYRAPRATTWTLSIQPATTVGLEPSIAIEPTGAIHIVSGDRGTGKGLTETTRACP